MAQDNENEVVPDESHEDGELHKYSGGEIQERTSTRVSPWLWGFWAAVIVAIVVTLIVTGAIPGLQINGMSYARPVYTTTAGYKSVEDAMVANGSTVMQLSPDTIDMYRLPLPDGQSLDQAVSKGTDIYQAYCIGCHGPNQDGNGPSSTSLDPKPRNLRNQPFMQALSYQRIWTSVHKGVPGTAMPRWENTLNDDQIKDVIAYVFSLTAPTDTKGNFIRPTAAEIAGATAASTSPAPSVH